MKVPFVSPDRWRNIVDLILQALSGGDAGQ
jgi:hypothetical protein